MKMNWEKYVGYDITVIMKEYYGVVHSPKMEEPFYEIVFKAGKLKGVYDDGLLIIGKYKDNYIETFIPYESIKCVDIVHPKDEEIDKGLS